MCVYACVCVCVCMCAFCVVCIYICGTLCSNAYIDVYNEHTITQFSSLHCLPHPTLLHFYMYPGIKSNTTYYEYYAALGIQTDIHHWSNLQDLNGAFHVQKQQMRRIYRQRANGIQACCLPSPVLFFELEGGESVDLPGILSLVCLELFAALLALHTVSLWRAVQTDG